MTVQNGSSITGDHPVNDPHNQNCLDISDLFAEAIEGRKNCLIIGEISAQDLLALALVLEKNEGEL